LAAIKILTQAACEPLSLTFAKAQCRLEPNDTSEDDYLNSLIAAARERAEYVTNRALVQRTVREYRHHFPGHGGHHSYAGGLCEDDEGYQVLHRRRRHWELLLSPVQFIVQLQYLDQTGTIQTMNPPAPPVGPPYVDGVTSLANPAAYSADLILEPATISAAPCWPLSQVGVPNTVWVDYVVGYSEDDSKVPAGIKQAMALMVSHWYINRELVQSTGIAEMPLASSDLLKQFKVRYQP
jgi:hypothetical protein